MDPFLHWNQLRFDPSSRAGHYESYFMRGNHPEKPLAFWFRYTVFCPKNAPEKAEGELWGMWFDGEKRAVIATYEAHPWSACSTVRGGFDFRIAHSALDGASLKGSATSSGHAIAWDLTYGGGQAPMLLYPEPYYTRSLPKAKVLVGMPNCLYDGTVTVDGETHAISKWPGTQSHNWGSKHTDIYAWAQIAGFEDAPDAFFEGASAKIKIGPLWSPQMTPMVLRVDGEEHAFNTPSHFFFSSSGRFENWRWEFSAKNDRVALQGVVSADKSQFAALPYRNPPGGIKRCLNSKIARGEITLRFADGKEKKLVTQNRAAFEILGDPAMLERRGFTL